MQCPNCSYKLVLLSNRRKYKCALCSKLYSQKLIENKEFQKYTKLQRQLDITNYNLKRQQELQQLKDIKKSLKCLFPPKSLNKQYLRQKSKEWRLNNIEYDLQRKREYRKDNKELVNLRSSIRHYRRKQKALALAYLKSKHYKASTTNIFHSVPTSLHSELLTET